MPLPPTDPIIARALDRATGCRPIPGNAVDLLLDGPVTYPAMLDLIGRATRWIHFENYIIHDDATGWTFARALAARARAGVAVRVLADWLGCRGTGARYWRFLRAAGVEVRLFHPPSWDLFQNFIRDHRKVVVADGLEAITGGLCIGDEWAGDPAAARRPWRDTAVRVAGPAVQALDNAFRRTWAVAGGTIPEEERVASAPECGTAIVRVIAVEPGQARSYRMLQLLAAGAGTQLWITDAYLVPPPPLHQGLVDAAHDGTDVRLLVPGASDLPLVRNLTRIGYRDLLRAGVRILEWEGPMLHAKSFVVDGRYARVGSSNLNASSLLGNYELDLLIEDREFTVALEAQFRLDSAESTEVRLRPRRAPERLQELLPPAFAHEPGPDSGEHPPIPPHRLTARERRGRAVVALRTVASAARRSLYAPAILVLLAVTVLAALLPHVVAWAVGALSLYLAASAAAELFRRRSPGSPTDEG
ncbi:MAG TPA: phosphatidylserine/phosphatidylglycerophosphate/cardiolipin synthase family protein [Gemmatimonadales bacterium]|nr:phosphatidylserine/phosphatidylglycerophosphate/cardiolipin synthase family protein [Gemmatimonadales bacterium]